MSCGLPLGERAAADAAREQQVAASAPAPLVDKMRAAKLTGERKPVTALFADVVGSTTLAESMDPEDWTQIVNEAFDLMSKAVIRDGGTRAQRQGVRAPSRHERDRCPP